MRKNGFLHNNAKTKALISFAVTAKLISAFVFASWKEQYVYFLNTKLQACSHFLWMYSPVCVGHGRKPRRPVFSQQGSYSSSYAKKKSNNFDSAPNGDSDQPGCQPSLIIVFTFSMKKAKALIYSLRVHYSEDWLIRLVG